MRVRRGPDDLVFSIGYETDRDIAENLRRLIDGDMEVSVRRGKRLNITEVKPGRAAEPGGQP
jgi:hypothetical protein